MPVTILPYNEVCSARCFPPVRIFVGFLCSLIVAGCSSVSVERYNPSGSDKPAGIPFHLTKPMQKVTTTTYEFRQLSDPGKVLFVKTLQAMEIINVVDTGAMFTINKTKAFVGETKFEFQRTVPAVAGTGEASSADLSIVKTEDKEGLTEFLKGLMEGAKSVVEAAKTAKEGAKEGAAAGMFLEQPDAEATWINGLLTKDILVVKAISVDLRPIP